MKAFLVKCEQQLNRASLRAAMRLSPQDLAQSVWQEFELHVTPRPKAQQFNHLIPMKKGKLSYNAGAPIVESAD